MSSPVLVMTGDEQICHSLTPAKIQLKEAALLSRFKPSGDTALPDDPLCAAGLFLHGSCRVCAVPDLLRASAARECVLDLRSLPLRPRQPCLSSLASLQGRGGAR